MAKKKELKILFSVAHFLQESDYSQSFERLIREAKLEGQIWKVSSSPSLTNVYTEFLPVTAEKVPLTHWVAQYLNHIGFPDSSSQLLSEASLQNEMGTFSTDAFNEFSDFLTHELKKKTEQTFSKKRTRLTEITKPNKRKTSILVDEENEDDYSVQQMAGDESSSFKETVAQLNASMPLDATSDGMKMAGDNEGNEDDG